MTTRLAALADPHELTRFSRAERAVHWTLTVLMLVCIATAAILYNGFLGVPIGHRRVVELIHVYSGFALPVALLAGLGFAAYRADLSRLNRFGPADWTWLRSRNRHDGTIGVGKFNAGQKLNAAFTVGAVLVMLGTGLIMYFTNLWPLAWRTGATFVHDWLALGIFLVVAGHLWFAAKDPHARLGMRTGVVPLGWAKREHGEWADEEERARTAPRLRS